MPEIAKSLNYDVNGLATIGCFEGTSVIDRLQSDANYIYAITPWSASTSVKGKGKLDSCVALRLSRRRKF